MLLNTQSGDADFKYMIDDLTVLYFGAKYSYGELLEQENCSVQFKRVIRNYFLKSVPKETTIESHLYYLAEGTEDFDAFRHLKAKVRVTVPVAKRGIGGKESIAWKEQVMKVSELAAISPEEKERRGFLIRELQVSKLGLMALS